MTDLTAVLYRPILFSGAMVRAILEGRKTQTRRVVKEADFSKGRASGEAWAWADAVYPARVSGWIAWSGAIKPGFVLEAETKRLYEHGFPCPCGAPGGRLWVRETWAVRDSAAGPRVEYQADGARTPLLTHHDIRDAGGLVDLPRYVADRWRPSIHMPRWASRITLEITGVRVERVQDISEVDAQQEGCDQPDWPRYYKGEPVFDAREAFRHLWNDINAARGYGWQDNPWVWVVEFKRLETA